MSVQTWALQRGYYICSGARREHLLSVYTLDRKPFFAVPSVVQVVNMDNDARVTNEPGSQI